jgi:hypothetical protein
MAACADNRPRFKLRQPEIKTANINKVLCSSLLTIPFRTHWA